jgi:membrane associated rhomboid family serine protease
MVPIGDGKRRFGFPWLTTFLSLAFVFLFCFEHFSGSNLGILAIVPYDTAALYPIGRLGASVASVLHQGLGWLEPIVNLVFFWVLGRKVEDACGSLGFLALCLFGAVGGVAFSLILTPYGGDPLFGLAGVVACLMGAYFVLFRLAPIRTFIPPLMMVPVPALMHFFYWAGLEFVNIDTFAVSARQWTQIVVLEPNWPFVGSFLIGLVAGQLFARTELVFYRTLKSAKPVR